MTNSTLKLGEAPPACELSAPVYEIDPLSDHRWKTLVDTHTFATVFHAIGWLRALHRTYGFQPTVLTTNEPGMQLDNGIVLCRVRSWLTGDRLVSLPFSDHCQPLVQESSKLVQLLFRLETHAGRGDCKYVEIRPLEPFDSAIELKVRLSRDESFCMHTLNLRASADDLFKNFHKNSVRSTIRKAQREGIRIEEGTKEPLLEVFYGLLILTRRRHRVPPQPIEWFRNLLSCFGGAARILVAFKDNVPVASIFTLAHNKNVVYKYGCSDPRFHNSGATSALIWHAIQAAQNAGFELFDFGRSELSNTGLVSFKDHWGATRTALRYYRYPWQPPAKTKSALKTFGKCTAEKLLPYLPDSVLTRIGELLYKHSA